MKVKSIFSTSFTVIECLCCWKFVGSMKKVCHGANLTEWVAENLARDKEPTAPLHSGGLTPSPLRGGLAVRQGPRADGLGKQKNFHT
jgi:hypothetical protein